MYDMLHRLIAIPVFPSLSRQNDPKICLSTYNNRLIESVFGFPDATLETPAPVGPALLLRSHSKRHLRLQRDI